jgi:2-isopropylmalate synthase
MKKIKIFDTTLRDGEQSPGVSLNNKEKLEIAMQLKKLGVDIIEAGFPASNEEDFESVKEISKNVRGPVICALSRARKGDIDVAWEALKFSKNPRIHIFLATSKIHLEKKLKKTEEEILDLIRENISYAKTFFKDIEFSPEDSSRTSIVFLLKAIETAVISGANIINITDTVGYSQPEEFYERVKTVFEKHGNLFKRKNVEVSVHCHNDLGLAVANSLAGIKAGATQVECTVNGIGERAGNCSLEEVIMNLKTRGDIFDAETGINYRELFYTSKLVSSLTGLVIQKNKAIVGANAFSHEAGIHQHGILNDKFTYEIICPEDVGWEGDNIFIGKHSGKHALEKILLDLGFNFDSNKIESIFVKIKALSNEKKPIGKDEILFIVNNLNN